MYVMIVCTRGLLWLSCEVCPPKEINLCISQKWLEMTLQIDTNLKNNSCKQRWFSVVQNCNHFEKN